MRELRDAMRAVSQAAANARRAGLNVTASDWQPNRLEVTIHEV
jgi:hypothetical protein